MTLRQNLSNFREIAQFEESSPTNLFNMCIEGHILVNNNSKFIHSITGGQDIALQNKTKSPHCVRVFQNIMMSLLPFLLLLLTK